MKGRVLIKSVIFFISLSFSSSCGMPSGSGDENMQTETSGTTADSDTIKKNALIVISPHPDDESIIAGGLIYSSCRNPETSVSAIYLSSGDGAGLEGKCLEASIEEKKEKIISLREQETKEAWEILGLDASRIFFLRYPDTDLTRESRIENGRRIDTLKPEGDNAIAEITDLVLKLIPENAQTLTIISGSCWDAHPDHRVAYLGARSSAESVSAGLDIPVTLLTSIVHDEFQVDMDFCCLGDLHWPNRGPKLDYSSLVDSKYRPRPPKWNVVHDIKGLTGVRANALKAHKSQVDGCPELCMVLVYKEYYRRWMEKTEEVFYKEEFH